MSVVLKDISVTVEVLCLADMPSVTATDESRERRAIKLGLREQG
jgi:hypothetical protein